MSSKLTVTNTDKVEYSGILLWIMNNYLLDTQWLIKPIELCIQGLYYSEHLTPVTYKSSNSPHYIKLGPIS